MTMFALKIKKLNQIGVDYRKLGIAFYCNNCKAINPTPLERWTCQSANHTFSIEEANSERLFAYTLNEDKRESILQIFDLVQPIAKIFEEGGFKVEKFYAVKGESGVQHVMDVYASKNKDKSISCVANILVEKSITSEEVLKLYTIGLDIKATKTFLIAMPKLDDASHVFAKKLSLPIIEGNNLEEVKKQLNAELESLEQSKASYLREFKVNDKS